MNNDKIRLQFTHILRQRGYEAEYSFVTGPTTKFVAGAKTHLGVFLSLAAALGAECGTAFRHR